LAAATIFDQEEIIDPGMDVHTITTTTSNDTGRSRSNMPTFPDPGPGTNSISGTDDDDLNDSDLDDDDDDEEVDVDGLDDQDAEGVENAIIDIREPLINLKKKLEAKLEIDLTHYDFYLQDTQPLHAESTLVDQCIQGEGPVQINVQIKEEFNDQGKKVRKINIVDVLKPSDDIVAAAQIEGALAESGSPESSNRTTSHTASMPPLRSLSESSEGGFLSSPEMKPKITTGSTVKSKKKPSAAPKSTTVTPNANKEETVTRWIVCSAFRKEQEKLNIPTDPTQWERMHVAHWAKWAKKEFPEASFDPISSEWDVDGQELCSLSNDEFKKKVAYDPGDLMWTHLELLRKCKFVAVVQKTKPENQTAVSNNTNNSTNQKFAIGSATGTANNMGGTTGFRKTIKKPPVRLGAAKFTVMTESSSPNGGNRSGNNGQIQLWQYLLELLTDKDHRDVIHWIGDEGEFKLENPETVAQLWGTRKNKPNMNYEKLSRALRYYYDGDMISKVHGKRFVYKFVCDLKGLIGYTASELNSLVIEAEQKANGTISVFNQI